jgi:hypothetical protein
MRKEPRFAAHAAGKAGKLSALSDHAMARDRDKDRVPGSREADRASRARMPDAPRDLAVRRRPAERDL